MRFLRCFRRLVFLAGFTSLCYLFLLVTSPSRFHKDPARWRARLLSGWARGTARLLGMRIEVRGEPPRAPFFLVANHLGYLDVLVLASQAPCAFIAKAEIARWPVFGALCRAVNTVFIQRESKRDILSVVEKIETTLRRDVGVVVFPEATSSMGAEVLPFRPALLEGAARTRLPVSYAALSYRTSADAPPAHRSVCWWGTMSFGRHLLGLLGVRRIEARVSFGPDRIFDDDRKVLAERLRRAVAACFEPVVASDSAAPRA